MLKIIDFSNGIRSEEIQENFNILQDEINRERINIGGTGIASGLEITPIITSDRFAIKVSASSIVTNDGEEIYIDEQIYYNFNMLLILESYVIILLII